MSDRKFVHLHVHTHYSLLDGACKVSDLVKRTKALGMDTLAISDHGCMFGAIDFYTECKKEGIKPIIGMEAYMAPGDRRERSTPGGNAGEAAYHLLLLAQDLEGYQNLVKLSSLAYKEGFYYKPRIDKEILREYRKGLIATSACLGGEVCSAFLRRDAHAARRIAETYISLFGNERFFIEVQNQGSREQDMVNPELVELARKLGVGVVGTNDVHFLTRDDHHAHDCLCCISMNKQITDETRMKYSTELYLKSPEEMWHGIGHFDGAMDNTLEIARLCNLELDFSKRYAPVYRVPDAAVTKGIQDDERYLREICEEGLEWRYGTREVAKPVRERLEHELRIIAMKNFCSYFLIVWDFCRFARDNGIPVGARGSGVGTMVGYLLGLCNVDPLKYGLLFERFMDPSRNEMPDIDIDICQDGRQRIIEYVRNKYGHVAQIITFGTLAAKAACKDVGRVLGISLGEVDKITKLIPGVPGMTLDKAIAQVPELKELYNNARYREMIDIAKRLEGMCRNAGCHAAGVIIADQPLDNIVPLYRDSDGNILTQFEGPLAEKCGLLKMDFLGLRTLSTITRAVQLVKQTKEIDIDIEKLELTDSKVLAMFARGETKGIFQFESGGMTDLLMKMQPDRVEDLIAANALFRPGPMELIPSYCNRKHGRERVPQVHPVMDSILAETYGIMVYQEQVMQIFNQLGGIELSNAYKLIKAISKKTVEVIAKFKPDFIKGAMSKGVSRDKAEEIFELILKFGGYGFNKSHSSRYAILAFQTAYLKTYHPVEYMSALLTYEMSSTAKIVEYIEECRRMGIKVLPPDINSSDKDFTPVYLPQKKGQKEKEGVIRFGLMAVKGVGEKAVESIIAERQARGAFASIYDFCERCDGRAVQKATIEMLVKCGAYSSLSTKRAPLLAVLESAFEVGQQHQSDRRNGQLAMFGAAPGGATARAPAPLPDIPDLPSSELLKFEKDLLGFYITSHPLMQHQAVIERYATATSREALTMSEGADVLIGGLISAVKPKVAKSGRSVGQKWAILELEDLDGKIEAMCFAEAFAAINQRAPGLITKDSIVLVKAKVDRKRETPLLIVNDIYTLDDAIPKLTTTVALKLDPSRHTSQTLRDARVVMEKHKGNLPVFTQVENQGGQKVVLKLPKELNVRPTTVLAGELDAICGAGTVQYFGQGSQRIKRLKQQAMFKEEPSEPDWIEALTPEELQPAEMSD